MKIDLNCDMGESFGNYKIGMDAEVVQQISSANVACGFHASDPVVMEKTVASCKAAGVAVGAHPGFPDLVGFGRRNLKVSNEELKAMIVYQVGALKAFCAAAGIPLQHVKPHGAMYNMAGKDAAMADAICEGIREVDPSLTLLGLSGSELIEGAKERDSLTQGRYLRTGRTRRTDLLWPGARRALSSPMKRKPLPV